MELAGIAARSPMAESHRFGVVDTLPFMLMYVLKYISCSRSCMPMVTIPEAAAENRAL